MTRSISSNHWFHGYMAGMLFSAAMFTINPKLNFPWWVPAFIFTMLVFWVLVYVRFVTLNKDSAPDDKKPTT